MVVALLALLILTIGVGISMYRSGFALEDATAPFGLVGILVLLAFGMGWL